MNKEPHGTAAHLREVFTIKGGVKNYKAEIETKAYLKFALFCLGVASLKAGVDKIGNIKLKIDQLS